MFARNLSRGLMVLGGCAVLLGLATELSAAIDNNKYCTSFYLRCPSHPCSCFPGTPNGSYGCSEGQKGTQWITFGMCAYSTTLKCENPTKSCGTKMFCPGGCNSCPTCSNVTGTCFDYDCKTVQP